MDLQDEALKLETSVVFLKSENIHATTNKYKLLYLRRALVLLLSASLLAIVLSFSTGLSFLHSYTYYFSTILFPLLTHTFERKYMFLLLNGILVFLAGKAGFCLPSGLQQEGGADDVQGKIISADQGIILQPAAAVDPICEKEAETCGETVMNSSCRTPSVILEQQNPWVEAEQQHEEGQEAAAEEDNEALAAEGPARLAEGEDLAEDQVFDEANEEKSGLIIEGQNDTESDGPASNTEELNKKIEEFIRKMKEELRLEAQQQQLIAA